jgi:hypothetical protein
MNGLFQNKGTIIMYAIIGILIMVCFYFYNRAKKLEQAYNEICDDDEDDEEDEEEEEMDEEDDDDDYPAKIAKMHEEEQSSKDKVE